MMWSRVSNGKWHSERGCWRFYTTGIDIEVQLTRPKKDICKICNRVHREKN